MQKLFLLFAVLFVVLLGCEQSTGGSTSGSPPEIIPTEGVIDGKSWSINEGTLKSKGTLYPALYYSVDGAENKKYTFMVSELPETEYYYLLRIIRQSPPYTTAEFDKVEIGGSLWVGNITATQPNSGEFGHVENSIEFSIFRVSFSGDRADFENLLKEGDFKFSLMKGTTVKDSFVVSENFQKLLKTFF